MEVVGDDLGLSKSSVSKTVTAVTPLLLQLMKNILISPQTPEEIQLANQHIDNISRVMGITDGTLIPVSNPVVNEPLYIYRKGYPAINVQIVCDHKGMFNDIVAKWLGRTHDSFVWATSAVCRWLKRVALVIAGCWETVDIFFTHTSCHLCSIQPPLQLKPFV